MPKIEGWSLTNRPYLAPECHLGPCIQGRVYGHPLFPDGSQVITSFVVTCQGREVITSSGSRYVLGKVDRKYAKLFPGARKRLFESAKKLTQG